MPKLDCLLVYHWQAWERFFISYLVEPGCHLKAAHGHGIRDLESRLTPGIRAVLPQVNLSYSKLFPARRRQLFSALERRGVLVLNTEIEDISKRNLHRLLEAAGVRSARAERTGPADEPLFVKANLNSGGEPETWLPRELRPRFLPHHKRLIRRWDGYFLAKRSELSPAQWANDSIVIERYIENYEDSFYRVYGFGDAIVVVRARSSQLIKKIYSHTRETDIYLSRSQILGRRTDLPTDLQRVLKGFLRHYPLAYFCLDIVHDGGAHYIIDLNLTPWCDPKRHTAEARAFLCNGAERYIQRLWKARFGTS